MGIFGNYLDLGMFRLFGSRHVQTSLENIVFFFCFFDFFVSLGFWFLKINPDLSKPNPIHVAPKAFLPNHCFKDLVCKICAVFCQASSFETSYLITISQRIQEHEESLLSSAGNKPLSRSFNMKMGPCPSTGMNMYICIYTNIILFYLNKTIDVKTNMHICTYTLLLSTLGFYVCLSFTVCFAVKISVPWFVHP